MGTATYEGTTGGKRKKKNVLGKWLLYPFQVWTDGEQTLGLRCTNGPCMHPTLPYLPTRYLDCA